MRTCLLVEGAWKCTKHCWEKFRKLEVPQRPRKQPQPQSYPTDTRLLGASVARMKNKVISFLGHYKAFLENSGWAVQSRSKSCRLSWQVCRISLGASQQGAYCSACSPGAPPGLWTKPSPANRPLRVSNCGDCRNQSCRAVPTD